MSNTIEHGKVAGDMKDENHTLNSRLGRVVPWQHAHLSEYKEAWIVRRQWSITIHIASRPYVQYAHPMRDK